MGVLYEEYKQLSSFLRRRLYYNKARNRRLVDEFHHLYYDSLVWKQTYWHGTQILKCPLDLWVYQEILHEQRPDVIVETGTHQGGSALYMAHLLDLLGHGRILTIDIQERAGRPQHKRITYLTGSSVDPAIVARVREQIGSDKRVLVILDSDHSQAHVEAELQTYADLVPPGGYLIVEDTNINGHPVYQEFGPGPAEAVETFLRRRKDFEVDPAREKFFLTMNPKGFLKRSK